MPVSKISTFGVRSLKAGGSRWIDQRSASFGAGLLVDGLAEHVPDAAERDVADGHRDRPAGVDDVGAARDPVRRVHRDRAHAVVAEVLLHLCDQVAAVRARDAQRRVDRGQAVREDGVDDDALDLEQLARSGLVPFVDTVSELLTRVKVR